MAVAINNVAVLHGPSSHRLAAPPKADAETLERFPVELGKHVARG
jgi:hypothetical protein